MEAGAHQLEDGRREGGTRSGAASFPSLYLVSLPWARVAGNNVWVSEQ